MIQGYGLESILFCPILSDSGMHMVNFIPYHSHLIRYIMVNSHIRTAYTLSNQVYPRDTHMSRSINRDSGEARKFPVGIKDLRRLCRFIHSVCLLPDTRSEMSLLLVLNSNPCYSNRLGSTSAVWTHRLIQSSSTGKTVVAAVDGFKGLVWHRASLHLLYSATTTRARRQIISHHNYSTYLFLTGSGYLVEDLQPHIHTRCFVRRSKAHDMDNQNLLCSGDVFFRRGYERYSIKVDNHPWNYGVIFLYRAHKNYHSDAGRRGYNPHYECTNSITQMGLKQCYWEMRSPDYRMGWSTPDDYPNGKSLQVRYWLHLMFVDVSRKDDTQVFYSRMCPRKTNKYIIWLEITPYVDMACTWCG